METGSGVEHLVKISDLLKGGGREGGGRGRERGREEREGEREGGRGREGEGEREECNIASSYAFPTLSLQHIWCMLSTLMTRANFM